MFTDIGAPLTVVEKGQESAAMPLRECSPGHWARVNL